MAVLGIGLGEGQLPHQIGKGGLFFLVITNNLLDKGELLEQLFWANSSNIRILLGQGELLEMLLGDLTVVD